MDRPQKVHDYLLARLEDPFNKFCIDCKEKQSTHVLVMYGAFMCASCANIHRQMFGFFETYPKDVMTDQFDDIQLAAISDQIGGNKQIYDLFVEYNILGLDSYSRYTHKCFVWYKKRLACSITGIQFDEEKPYHSYGEAVDKSAVQAKQVADGIFEDVKKIDTAQVKQ